MPDVKMKKLIMPAILTVFLFFALSSGVAPADTAQIKIGVLAKRGPEICIKKWAPTAGYLTGNIPGKTFVIVPLDFDEIFSSVEKGGCDFVLANPAFYVELESRFGANRIATLENVHIGHVYTQFGGVVFCRADRKDINSFNDLKEKIYATPDPFCLGAWIAVRRELKDAGLDPYADFNDLKFVGTTDAVVYAVRDGKADAGSVRTGTLEHMALEGKIDIRDFRMIGAREQTEAFPFIHSTRLYPEWPFASVKHTSHELAEQVAAALMEMPRDSTAARAAWTIPMNYRQVHECLRELKLGPYKDLRKVTLTDVFRNYRHLILVIFALIVVLAVGLVSYFTINRRVQMSYANLQLAFEERKRAEEALRKSEEKHRSLTDDVLDSSKVGIFILDSRFRVVWVNRALERYFGLRRDQVVGKDKRQLIHEQIADIFENSGNFAEKVLATYDNNTYVENFECHVLPDGKRKEYWLEHWSQPIKTGFYAEGRVEYYTDITARKQAEEVLKRNEARLKSVLQASPLGIALVMNRRIQWHNDAMSRMLGYSSGEGNGQNTRILYAGDEEFEQAGEAINALGPGKRTTHIETRWVRKDKSAFDCHIRYALLDPESKDSPIIAIAEDITERKKAEQEKKKLTAQLNQAQKMEAIGVLAGGVAHDFNNILSAVIGFADLALMELDKDTRIYRYMNNIRKSGESAASLTRQLLAFSRKDVIRPEVINLNQVAMDFEKMLRRLIGEDIDLTTGYAPDLWPVKADPGQMEQVIMNLCINARDAMPAGGNLTIETANVALDERYFQDHAVERAPGSYVMLAITDSGMGMDQETRARVFEPFFTTKEMGRGTGLGLSTVFGIVKQNNGHIWVYSEEGEGTTFKVYLPRADDDTAVVEKKRSSGQLLTGSETILVAEDDKMLRDIAKRMLMGAGYRVLTAGDGSEAIKISDRHEGSIHLLLTDVVMPGMSGRDLAEQLKAIIPDLKILYMSGYTDNVIAQHGVLEKDVEFIQKPFTQKSLAGKVREVLDS